MWNHQNSWGQFSWIFILQGLWERNFVYFVITTK